MQALDKPTNRQTNKPGGRAYTYRNLEVWERSQDLAARIIALARKLPRDPGMAEITKQLVRSVGSIGANISEGHGRFTRLAYANHLVIAKGSASEVGSWLDLLRRIEEIDARVEAELQAEIDSLIGLLKFKIRQLYREDANTKPASRARRTASSTTT